MNLCTAPIDHQELKRAYSCFPSGVVALCGLLEDEPAGMVASSFTTVSLDPPIVSVCIQESSTTWLRLRRLQRLGVSVLSEGQHTICRALAGRGKRFENVSWTQTSAGAVFVESASAVFDCSVREEIQAGDHVIALLEVGAMHVDFSRQPLVFHHSRLRQFGHAS